MSHRYNEAHDLTSIIVKKTTRQHLRNIGHKHETYDTIIQKLDHYRSIFEYLRENYPSILTEWKNKKGLRRATSEPEQQTTGVTSSYDTRDIV